MLLEELKGIAEKQEPPERRSVFVAAWLRAACHRGRTRSEICCKKAVVEKTTG